MRQFEDKDSIVSIRGELWGEGGVFQGYLTAEAAVGSFDLL